jgi:hypothetical protein
MAMRLGVAAVIGYRVAFMLSYVIDVDTRSSDRV